MSKRKRYNYVCIGCEERCNISIHDKSTKISPDCLYHKNIYTNWIDKKVIGNIKGLRSEYYKRYYEKNKKRFQQKYAVRKALSKNGQ